MIAAQIYIYIILVIICIIVLYGCVSVSKAFFTYLDGANTCIQEEVIESGEILRGGVPVAYYRLVKRYYANGESKVFSERTNF